MLDMWVCTAQPWGNLHVWPKMPPVALFCFVFVVFVSTYLHKGAVYKSWPTESPCSSLWLSDTQDTTLLQQLTINKGDLFFLLLLPHFSSSSSSLCYSAPVPSNHNFRQLPRFLKVHSEECDLVPQPTAVKRRHYYRRSWSWHSSPSNGVEWQEAEWTWTSPADIMAPSSRAKNYCYNTQWGSLARDGVLGWNRRWEPFLLFFPFFAFFFFFLLPIYVDRQHALLRGFSHFLLTNKMKALGS